MFLGHVCGRVQAVTMSPESLIAFESRWPGHNGTKDLTIRDELGMTPARYYVLLYRAASTAEGMSADPITARRVRERLL